MRSVLILALLVACGSKSAGDPTQDRKNYAHVLGENMRKAGVTATFDTRGDDATTLVITGDCSRDLLDQLVADDGDNMRNRGFVTLECDHGDSVVLAHDGGSAGAAQSGSDPWAR